jgi:hypothetical protein
MAGILYNPRHHVLTGYIRHAGALQSLLSMMQVPKQPRSTSMTSSLPVGLAQGSP